jgi:hypothetical protein
MRRAAVGLLAYPLRRVVSRRSTGGGNPFTNPPRTWFLLECGHRIEMPGQFVVRKSCRCDQCPRRNAVGRPLIEIL